MTWLITMYRDEDYVPQYKPIELGVDPRKWLGAPDKKTKRIWVWYVGDCGLRIVVFLD